MKTLSGEGGRNPFPRRPRRRVEQHGLSPWLQATPGGGQLLGSQPFSLRKSKEECVHFNARTAPARGSTTALRLIALSFQHASALYTTPMAQIQSPRCTHSPARSPGPPAPAAAHTVETSLCEIECDDVRTPQEAARICAHRRCNFRHQKDFLERERDSRTASARGQVVGRRGEGGWEESERASEQGRQPLKIGQPHGNRPHENNAGPACREPRVVINLSHPRAGSNGGVGAHTCRPPCCLRARSRPPASPVPPYPPQHIPGALESGRDLVGIRGLKHPRHLRSVVAGHVRSCSLHLRDTPQMNTHPGILARRAPARGAASAPR